MLHVMLVLMSGAAVVTLSGTAFVAGYPPAFAFIFAATSFVWVWWYIERAGTARAARRRARGQCGRCSYDLTGNVSGVCPECGGDPRPNP